MFAMPGEKHGEFQIPCGQCVGCRLERSRQWAVRCVHESQLHVASSFVTLTYSDENLPFLNGLAYSHFQKFMKRLRKKFPRCRFFMCGEYGDNFGRPHYHALLFGVHFSDRTPWRMSSGGFQLYRSRLLESLWTLGNSEIGDVSFESAAYVARYCMKKVTGKGAVSSGGAGAERPVLGAYERLDMFGEIHQISSEFAHMSLKPGIGAGWIAKYKSDVYPEDVCVINGVKVKPPKYYLRYLQSLPGVESDLVEFERYKKGLEFQADNTPERLAVREVVARARLGLKRRSLE